MDGLVYFIPAPVPALPPSPLTIAVIGDIHDQWTPTDNQALKHLGVDLALFVGDYGNESVDIVRQIAALDLPKAAILGNHDAHYTATTKGQKKRPYDPAKEDRVQQQLDLLGSAHVGFGKREFPQFNLTVVGGRPFSPGGSKWRFRKFYRDRYDVRNFQDSEELILAAADEAQSSTIIFLSHVGPYGLGSQPEDICGKDWGKKGGGGDYGDPDFANAIALTQETHRRVPLVTFGHMHHLLKNKTNLQRKRIVRDSKGTLYFNAAYVPRIESVNDSLNQHSFSLVKLQDGSVDTVEQIWLSPQLQELKREYLFTSSH